MNTMTWASIAVLMAGSALVLVLYLRELYRYAKGRGRVSGSDE